MSRPSGGYPPIVLSTEKVNVDANRGFSSTIVNIGDIINYKREKAESEAFNNYVI